MNLTVDWRYFMNTLKMAKIMIDNMCDKQDVFETDIVDIEILVENLAKEIEDLSENSIIYQYLMQSIAE
jgi:hypothetical protein